MAVLGSPSLVLIVIVRTVAVDPRATLNLNLICRSCSSHPCRLQKNTASHRDTISNPRVWLGTPLTPTRQQNQPGAATLSDTLTHTQRHRRTKGQSKPVYFPRSRPLRRPSLYKLSTRSAALTAREGSERRTLHSHCRKKDPETTSPRVRAAEKQSYSVYTDIVIVSSGRFQLLHPMARRD